MDESAYRVETDNSMLRAYANFGDRKAARSYAAMFDDVLYRDSDEIVAVLGGSVEAAWFLCSSPDQFGDYKSFLEIGFALNGLFGVWEAIPQALAKRRRTARRASVGKYAEELGAEVFGRVDRISAGIVWIGRTLGVVGALAIATALFLIPDTTCVTRSGAAAIAGICMPVPVAILAAYVVDWGFVAVVTGRKSRRWMSYWWFVLRNLRRVGKADEIRELWRKRRDGEREDSGE